MTTYKVIERRDPIKCYRGYKYEILEGTEDFGYTTALCADKEVAEKLVGVFNTYTNTLVRDMARYIQYLENQHECIGNRDDMPSKKWWDQAPDGRKTNFLQLVGSMKEGIASTWSSLGE